MNVVLDTKPSGNTFSFDITDGLTANEKPDGLYLYDESQEQDKTPGSFLVGFFVADPVIYDDEGNEVTGSIEYNNGTLTVSVPESFLRTAVYPVVVDPSISTQDSDPEGVVWGDNGNKLYEVGSNSDYVYQYAVPTAYDISSASFSKSENNYVGSLRGMVWNDDGTKLYEVNTGGGFTGTDGIYEHDVSTAYDVSTASYSQDIVTQDTEPRGIAWNNDGTKLYEIGFNSDKIYEYDVSTAYDISTASFSQSIDTQDGSPQGIAWNNDGSKLYEIGSGSNKVYEYDVSTAYDISTASFSQSISTQDSNPRGIVWNDNGTKLYEVGSSSDKIYENYVCTPYDISTFQTSPCSTAGSARKTNSSGVVQASDGVIQTE
jgi:sugar lactone lactonase YvrE